MSFGGQSQRSPAFALSPLIENCFREEVRHLELVLAWKKADFWKKLILDSQIHSVLCFLPYLPSNFCCYLNYMFVILYLTLQTYISGGLVNVFACISFI
jgi:hypothetical protein